MLDGGDGMVCSYVKCVVWVKGAKKVIVSK
jgi:hypothetical protein